MRLTPEQRQIIRDASLRHFGVPPRLFGSRVEDSRRGGDIDLCIEAADLSAKEAIQREMRMCADLHMALGARKIDIDIDIAINTGQLDLPIYGVALKQGVWL